MPTSAALYPPAVDSTTRPPALQFGNFTDSRDFGADMWLFEDYCDGPTLRMLQESILQLPGLRSVQFLDWGRENTPMGLFRRLFFSQWLEKLSSTGLVSFQPSGLPESQEYIHSMQKVDLTLG